MENTEIESHPGIRPPSPQDPDRARKLGEIVMDPDTTVAEAIELAVKVLTSEDALFEGNQAQPTS